MANNIRIDRDDLYSRRVDDIVAEQEAMGRAGAGPQTTSLWRRILFSTFFILSVAGGTGGLIGWALIEPYFDDGVVLWGKIEAINLVEKTIYVQGFQVFVDDRVTRVSGLGEYAGPDRLADLEEDMPVQVNATAVQVGFLMATRVVIREIPPEHVNAPPPDVKDHSVEKLIAGLVAFAVVGSCIAGLIAAADGLVSRNIRRGLLCGVVGIGLAAAGGLVGLIPAGAVMQTSSDLVTLAVGEGPWSSQSVTGFPLMLLIVGRSITWGIISLTVGLGQGTALRNKKLALNGLLGGMLGGLLGGMAFEPILKVFANTDLADQATISRAFGFAVIGVSAGFMIGLVEHLSKDAWLLMRSGPLNGKQFVIYKTPTTLGSSPKCDIYLFKDPDVDPRHAVIHKSGTRHEIEDTGTPNGTYVNKQKITRHMLQDGDFITIGATTLEYSERSRSET